MEFVKTFNVQVDEAHKGVRWDEQICTGCGNCVTHCPTGALHVPDRGTMEITYDSDLCVECLSCISNCPYGACSSIF